MVERKRLRFSAVMAAGVIPLLVLLATSCGVDVEYEYRGADHAVLESGAFPVGITSFSFVDDSRSTPANDAQPGSRTRSLEVRVWYPAVAPSADQAQDDDFASIPDPTPMFNAPPATGSGPFPLIVFSHGLSALPADYGDLLAAWASAGYVVAAPKFPLSSREAPGGADAADVANQPGDVSAVIRYATQLSASAAGRQLAGMIDGDRVGVAGHSNGGITTAGIVGDRCCHDASVSAAVILSGTSQVFPNGGEDWSQNPPLLVVHGEKDTLVPVDAGIRLFNSARAPKGLLRLLDADHATFVVSSSPSFPVTVRATVDFWNGYLKGDVASIDALPDDQQKGIATMDFIVDPTDDSQVELTTPAMGDRKASVTPSTGLRDGQTVKVSWSGFLPGRVINIVQCSGGGLGSSASCNLVTGKILQPDPTGEGSLELQIVEGQVGTGMCDSTTVDCVIVVNDASLPDEDANLRIPISFAP